MSPTPTVRALRRIGYVLFFGGLGFLIVGLIYFNVSSNALAQQIKSGQKDTQRTAAIILDCTQPSGTCFQNGERRTGQAVSLIKLAQVAAVACADRPGQQSLDEINACVERTMRVIKKRGQAQ